MPLGCRCLWTRSLRTPSAPAQKAASCSSSSRSERRRRDSGRPPRFAERCRPGLAADLRTRCLTELLDASVPTIAVKGRTSSHVGHGDRRRRRVGLTATSRPVAADSGNRCAAKAIHRYAWAATCVPRPGQVARRADSARPRLAKALERDRRQAGEPTQPAAADLAQRRLLSMPAKVPPTPGRNRRNTSPSSGEVVLCDQIITEHAGAEPVQNLAMRTARPGRRWCTPRSAEARRRAEFECHIHAYSRTRLSSFVPSRCSCAQVF